MNENSPIHKLVGKVISVNVIQNTIDTLEKQFNDAEQKIIDGKNELEAKKAELEETKESTYAELATWKVNNGKQELQDAEETLAENKIEFEEKIKEAEIKLLDAKEKINDIENPKWYILDRTSNAGYKGYYDDTQSILNIGKVFPLDKFLFNLFCTSNNPVFSKAFLTASSLSFPGTFFNSAI